MYGCKWDDQTGETNGFLQEGYDGEDFLSVNLEESRWISPMQQGALTVQKLNKDTANIEYQKQYFSDICIEWLQKYVQYGKSSLQKTVSPQVFLLQKSSSSPVSCHATGFYPSEVKISWMKNDEDHDEDVDLGELLPNEDGTFQKTSTIRITAEERKKNKYSCVVEHQGKTFREILPDDVNGNQVLYVCIASPITRIYPVVLHTFPLTLKGIVHPKMKI
uniref:Ig-like domain-containing protein n=1 Tax=Cyprinus carpio carpio TaxID=630221 RepID=A0A8C1DZT0_CYPCA